MYKAAIMDRILGTRRLYANQIHRCMKAMKPWKHSNNAFPEWGLKREHFFFYIATMQGHIAVNKLHKWLDAINLQLLHTFHAVFIYCHLTPGWTYHSQVFSAIRHEHHIPWKECFSFLSFFLFNEYYRKFF